MASLRQTNIYVCVRERERRERKGEDRREGDKTM
jgi:hypothetical protein